MIPAGRPLHVVQLDPNANTPPYDRALGAALAAAGCRVDLMTSRFLYEELPHPVDFCLDERFFRLAGTPAARLLGIDRRPAVRRALKAAEYPLDWTLVLARLAARRPDIVHVQWTVQPSLDLAVWRLMRALRLPLAYTVHNLVPHASRPADVARYGRLYRAADALIVHSERSAAELRARWGIPAERIAVVPMGPMLAEHPTIPRATAREQLGLSADAEVVLFAGLIEPYKGLDDLIEAFQRLAGHRPAARLVVAGKPNASIEPGRRALDGAGLAARATFDLRFLPEPALAAYLCAADVVALPYRDVTSSAMLLAARRFGCAVVATDVGDLGELIRDGESGLLVPPRSPADLSAAIEHLLADPPLARRLGAAGRSMALGPHGWPAGAARTLALYRRLLA